MMKRRALAGQALPPACDCFSLWPLSPLCSQMFLVFSVSLRLSGNFPPSPSMPFT